MASSRGASTSSSTQKGDGLTRKMANSSDTAVMAFSPPESSSMFCMTFLPGGLAMMSTPVSSRSFSSVRASWAFPPPKQRGKISWNFSFTASKTSRKRRLEALLIFSMAPSSWRDRRFQILLLGGEVVEALLQLGRLLDGGQVDLPHPFDEAAQLGHARPLPRRPPGVAGGSRTPPRPAGRPGSDRPAARRASCGAGWPPGSEAAARTAPRPAWRPARGPRAAPPPGGRGRRCARWRRPPGRRARGPALRPPPDRSAACSCSRARLRLQLLGARRLLAGAGLQPRPTGPGAPRARGPAARAWPGRWPGAPRPGRRPPARCPARPPGRRADRTGTASPGGARHPGSRSRATCAAGRRGPRGPPRSRCSVWPQGAGQLVALGWPAGCGGPAARCWSRRARSTSFSTPTSATSSWRRTAPISASRLATSASACLSVTWRPAGAVRGRTRCGPPPLPAPGFRAAGSGSRPPPTPGSRP